MEQGYVSRASKTLFEDTKSINPRQPGVLGELQSLQCPRNRLPFPESRGQIQPTVIKDDALKACINSLQPDSSVGPFGWPVFLLKLAFKQPRFAEFLLVLINEVVRGEVPLQELLCASRLVPLRKPNGKVRPIAVGELFFYRIAGRAALMSQRCMTLLPQQLGVGTPRGVEPLVALLRSRLTEANSCIQLDFVNAFNSIHHHVMAKAVHQFCPTLSRFVTWAYSSSSWLSVSGIEEPLLNKQGVRQGDNVGSYLFSLGI
jgi:hypothetical protein